MPSNSSSVALRRLRSILLLGCFAVCFGCVAAADEDGAFCVGKGYLAFEVRPASEYAVPQHVLHVMRFDAAHGIRQAGEVSIISFQVHGLTCGSDRVEISGWGKAFEHYVVAIPAIDDQSASPSATAPLQIIEHHSDPAAKFDPTKDTPEPQWLWRLPIGSHSLKLPGENNKGYFLVISGSDKRATAEVRHRRTATLVQKDDKGTIQQRLRIYENVDVETID